jgi:hypothetical protein
MFDDMQNARKIMSKFIHGKLTVRIFYFEYIENVIRYFNKSSQA